ncbi:MAG: MFS transporter [Steroidobacteraceae bacterium]
MTPADPPPSPTTRSGTGRFRALGIQLSATDLLRDATYRRLWSSILISSFGGQITLLALPLTAAVLLHASPTQMGLLTAMEIVPYVLFSLPSGVWLDRIRKLPVYVAGELSIAVAVASVPLAWKLGIISISWLYVVGFIIGSINTVAGSAAQIVLTQIVPRERLVEAHAKNALASSAAEVAGPGAAGALIKLTGAPLALIADAAMLLASAFVLRGLRVRETPSTRHEAFWPALRAGLTFVRQHALLVAMASCVGAWDACSSAATAVQILFATHTLGLSERGVGLSYVALGLGTIGTSAVGHLVAKRLGPGPSLVLGFAVTGCGWLMLAMAPVGTLGVAAFAFMLFLYGCGAVLIFINFLSLRQAVTPAPMLGRMTTTMRFLILIPAGPGALIGGWLGEQISLRATLLFAGFTALAVALVAWRLPVIRRVRTLPTVKAEAVTPFCAEDEPGAVVDEAAAGGSARG